MARKFVGTNQYKKGNGNKKTYGIPYTEDPDKKDRDYFKKWAEYIWSQYVNDRTLLGFGGYTPTGRSLEELRLYGVGQQPREMYMDILDKCDDPNANEGYMNINWDNVQIMPKFRDVVRGKMIGMDYEVYTTAIDEKSTKERVQQTNMMKLLVNPAIQQIMAQTGVVPSNVKLPPGLETVQDIDNYVKMGGLRLSRELMIQDAIESTNYESGWQTVKAQVCEDIIDFGIGATRTYVERATGIVKIEHVDPINLIIRPSKYQDHRDADYAGFIERRTLEQIRMESDLTEEMLYKIAKKYKSHGGNGNYIGNSPAVEGYQNTAKTAYSGNWDGKPYDDFSVDVMTFYFIGKEAEQYIMGVHHRDGNFIYDKVDMDAKLSKKDLKRGKQKDEKVVEWVYSAKWIVGTECVYDYGKEYAVVRENKNGVKRAVLPLQVYSDRSPSIVERCIPFIDDIQLSVLKKRNTLSKMAPGPRMAIDKSLVEDSVVIGSQNFTVLDLIELFPKTGVLVYESVGEWEDSEMSGSNRPPITFMPSGIQEDIGILLQDVQFSLDQIRQTTGINEVADGTTQQQDMLIKVMDGLAAATNNALRPHFQILYGLYENQCKYVAQKWQVAVLSGEINTKYIPIGDNIIKPVKMSKDLYDYDFGIKINIKPTEEDKQHLLALLTQLQQTDQIAMSDYWILYNMIQSGDFKKAQMYLAKANERYLAMKHQQTLEQMQAQAQSNAESANAAEMAKLQADMQRMQIEMQSMQEEYRLKGILSGQEHQQRLVEIQTEKGMDMQQSITEKTMDMAANEPV